MLRPRSVSQVHMDGGTVSEEVVQNTYSYLALYMGIMVLSVFLIALDEFSLETNPTAWAPTWWGQWAATQISHGTASLC